jgi:DNA repair protein RadD
VRFITRTSPKIWDDMIYYKQISDLFDEGYLAKLDYYPTRGIDPSLLRLNKSGTEFTDESMKAAFKASDMEARIVNLCQRLLSGEKSPARKNALIFTKFVEEAKNLTEFIPNSAYVCGETPKREREQILGDFKAGRIKVVANVGVLTTGFDFPELETIVLARPTMSLSLYYQMLGRAIRPHPDKKSAWIVDMCGTYSRFGPVEEFKVGLDAKGKPIITGARMVANEKNAPVPSKQRRQLTNAPLVERKSSFSTARAW